MLCDGQWQQQAAASSAWIVQKNSHALPAAVVGLALATDGPLQKTTHLPNPDVFVAMIWNTLMGPRVLDLVMPASTTVVHGACGWRRPVPLHCRPDANLLLLASDQRPTRRCMRMRTATPPTTAA